MLGVFSRIIKDKGYKVYSSSDCPSYTLYNNLFKKLLYLQQRVPLMSVV